ncbi:hypothetical protein BT96DRAFT_995456 [Gymnopus androsaceus JB14]|uniref:Uncharacterized protein n=1 Tax=Gymnopus androsaceus JB14 TaxID=1447944 RepID=A0A6A4HGU5_9AGAR|nr:hypothetical protein BT96DRAFT_995456 [Gymnopus androsaceus JB14]
MKGNEIREGASMMTSPTAYKRLSSLTRTLSRIPVGSVGNMRALADKGTLSLNSATPPSPSSPLASKRHRGTAKVIANLQAGIINARNALENKKPSSTSDSTAKGGETAPRSPRTREESRIRSYPFPSSNPNPLNRKNHPARWSLLYQSQQPSRRNLNESMLRSASIKHLTESWKLDTDRLRDEIRKREEKWKAEAEVMGKKYRRLVEEVQASRSGQEDVKQAREEDTERAKQIESRWLEEIERIK